MRKEEMTIFDILVEAVTILSALLYFGLQIYYGISYGAGAMQILMNIETMLLVYIGLSLLQIYPERVNGLPKEVCTGKIRKYTIHMVRYIKVIFILSLLLTSFCDAAGKKMDGAYSLIVIGLIIVIAVVYEILIIRIFRENQKK